MGIMSRRKAVALAAASGGALITAALAEDAVKRTKSRSSKRLDRSDSPSRGEASVINKNLGKSPRATKRTPFKFEKFTQPLPIPPIKRPLAIGKENAPFEVASTGLLRSILTEGSSKILV